MTTIKVLIPLFFIATSIFDAIDTKAQLTTDEERVLVDSLINVYNHTSDEQQQLQLLEAIARHHDNVDSTIVYANKLISLSRKLNKPGQEAQGLSFLAWAYYNDSKYLQASEMSRKSILIADSINDKKILGNSYYQLANEYSMLNDISIAIEYYQKALEIQEEFKDTSKICDILKNIAQTFAENMLYDDALECIERSKKLDEQYLSQYYLSEDYWMIGYTYYMKYCDTKYTVKDNQILNRAKENILTAINLSEKNKYKYGMLRSYIMGAAVLVEIADNETDTPRRNEILDSCYTYIQLAYNLSEQMGRDISELDIHEVYLHYLINADKKTLAMLDSLNIVFHQSPEELNKDISYLYHNYCIYYERQNEYKKALDYERISNELKSNLQKNDYAAKASRYMAQGNFNMQLRERELHYESDKHLRTIIIVCGSILLFFLVIFSISTIKSYKRTQEAYRALDIKNNELEKQKEEILVQNEYLEQQKEQIEKQRINVQEQNNIISQVNQQLTDSINYAGLIQQAALPSEGQMNSIFGNHMVIFKPLNIVSGDFYWATQVGNLKMLAVADCTGHGVPGAFLSMLGISILNDISARYTNKEIKAATMLDQMRSTFMNVLHQHAQEDENHDGIDISLIIINTETQSLSYAGAFRPIIIVRNHEAMKFSPDRMPIGAHYNVAEHFTNHDVELQNGDTIYLFTDGMTDQFGYDSQNHLHKYTSKRLRTLLADIHNQPFSVQQTKIELSFASWRLETQSLTDTGMPYEQTDDALLIGIRYNKDA